MKVSAKTPDWAEQLVIQVCKDYKRKLPSKLLWRHKDRPDTSGYTLYGKAGYVSVTAGDEEWQHKTVLLHELAHHLISKTRAGQRHGHSKKFWQILIELNERYGDVELAYRRDVELAREWRPGTRAKAVEAFAVA